jgi:fucose permease
VPGIRIRRTPQRLVNRCLWLWCRTYLHRPTRILFNLPYNQVITFGALLQVIAYCIQIPQPPFPLFVISYYINGFGGALGDAQSNGLVANLPTNAPAKMSILHGVYGLGAFVSPLVATQFSQIHRWTFHYLTTLAIGLITTCALAYVTRLKSQDGKDH